MIVVVELQFGQMPVWTKRRSCLQRFICVFLSHPYVLMSFFTRFWSVNTGSQHVRRFNISLTSIRAALTRYAPSAVQRRCGWKPKLWLGSMFLLFRWLLVFLQVNQPIQFRGCMYLSPITYYLYIVVFLGQFTFQNLSYDGGFAVWIFQDVAPQSKLYNYVQLCPFQTQGHANTAYSAALAFFAQVEELGSPKLEILWGGGNLFLKTFRGGNLWILEVVKTYQKRNKVPEVKLESFLFLCILLLVEVCVLWFFHTPQK